MVFSASGERSVRLVTSSCRDARRDSILLPQYWHLASRLSRRFVIRSRRLDEVTAATGLDWGERERG